jgi:hypothetical protein
MDNVPAKPDVMPRKGLVANPLCGFAYGNPVAFSRNWSGKPGFLQSKKCAQKPKYQSKERPPAAYAKRRFRPKGRT